MNATGSPEAQDDPISVEIEVAPPPVDRADRFGWERHRYGAIARTMEAQRISPAAAAEQVDAGLPDDLPFAIHTRVRTEGAPGGIRPSARETWLVMCRAETEEEPLSVPSDERLTGDMLRAAAGAYDPEFRTAKVILGHGGPSHVQGRFEPPVATIRAVEFDGHFLWGLARDTGAHALEWTVAMGAHDRSIFVRPSSELDGGPPYIDHVALLYGEWPVQPNLAPLPGLFARPEESRELARSEGWHFQALTPAKEDPMSKSKNTDPLESLPEDQRGLARTILDAVKGLLAKPEADPDPATPDPEATKPAARAEAGGDKGLARTIETLTEQVAALGAKIQANEEASVAAARSAHHKRVDAIVDGLVRAMQLNPNEAQSWREILKADDLSIERSEKMLEALAARPAAASLSRAVVVDGEGEEIGTVKIISSPSGLSADPERTALFARAEQLARTRTAGKGEAAYADELHRIVTQGAAELSN